jgi:predicted HicB family RNase H-like nuclease
MANLWENVRIRKELAKAVKAQAKKEGRSFANMVAYILQQYVGRL